LKRELMTMLALVQVVNSGEAFDKNEPTCVHSTV
jgi:hypothetical protein